MDGFKMFYFILELDKVFSLPRPLWPQKSWQLRSRVQPKRKIFHQIDFHHNDHHDHLGSGQGRNTPPGCAVPSLRSPRSYLGQPHWLHLNANNRARLLCNIIVQIILHNPVHLCILTNMSHDNDSLLGRSVHF